MNIRICLGFLLICVTAFSQISRSRNSLNLPQIINLSGSAPQPATFYSLQLVGPSSGPTNLFMDVYGGNPLLTMRRAQGTASAPTALASGNTIAALNGTGYNGTSFSSVNRATITMQATEAWSTTANGTRINFLTTRNATTLSSIKLVIDNDGKPYWGNNAIPVATGCTASLATSSIDTAGLLTAGVTGACVIDVAFHTAWRRAPVCFAVNETTQVPVYTAATTTNLTLTTTSNANDQIKYFCQGYTY